MNEEAAQRWAAFFCVLVFMFEMINSLVLLKTIIIKIDILGSIKILYILLYADNIELY